MATRPPLPSLETIFSGHPQQDQSDVAYSNVLDSGDPTKARRANVVGRNIGLPGATVSADVDGFDQEQHNNTTLNILGVDPHTASFLVDPHTAASVKDDLPALHKISSLFNAADAYTPKGGWTNYLNRIPPGGLLRAMTLSNRPAPPDYKLRPLTGAELTRAIRPIDPSAPMPAPLVPQSSDPASALPPDIYDIGKGVVQSTFGSILQSGQGAETYLADTLDGGKGSTVGDFLRSDAAATQHDVDANLNAGNDVGGKLPWAGQQVYSALQSIAQMGAAVATDNPIMAMSLQQGAQQYQQVRDRGGSPDEALVSGGISGAAEGVFEKYFGLGWMLGNFGKKATSKFVGGLLLREVPSEMATTAVQDAADAMVTGGGGWEAYKQRLPGDLLNTAASTAIMVGMMGTGHHVAHQLAPEARAVDDIERAAAGTQFVDDLMAAAVKSKTKAEDPQTLKEFIDHRTQDSPVRNIYLPVEAAVAYMQSEKYGGELDQYKDQIAQAQATQGDVVIPISDAVAHLSGTPAWDALKEDVRIEPGGLSRKEATKQHGEIIDQLEKRGKEIAAQADEKQGQLDASGEVYAEVKNRLRLSGVDDKQADAVAQIYAARYEARAARLGGTPMEQFQRSKIAFPGETVGQFEGGREVAQDHVNAPPLEGMPQNIKVGDERVQFGPHATAREAAQAYMKKAGLPYNPPRTYARVDHARATRIAQAFEDMRHNPSDPTVKAAYGALKKETLGQWKAIEKTGLKVEFIKGADPYGNPRGAILDVVNNNHLWVYPTDSGFGSSDADVSDNPLLGFVPGVEIDGQKVRYNDLFRIVHDYFGHIKEGVGFRADGEENAWRIHSAMFSPLARRALTTETRGQNSWVNFGPHGIANQTASSENTVYADQKIGLLPDWVVNEGAGDDRSLNQDAALVGWTGVSAHLTDEEKANVREATKQKILSLVETLPDAKEVAAAAVAGRAKKGWYEQSAQAILDVFGAADAPRFAALLASLSPQTSVQSNLFNALRTWTLWNDAGRPQSRREIVDIMGQAVQGKKGAGSVLNAWINNSFAALTAPDLTKLDLSGPKVNSFYANLVGAVDEVTNDTWMAMYSGLDAMGSGGTKTKTPLYKALNAVVRRAADILTKKTGQSWTPAEVQETVWSFAKTLYEMRDKAGETGTMRDLLKAGKLTHADIANTPDFAALFTNGVFRTILEQGGYGDQIAAIEGRGRSSDLAGEGRITDAAETGFSQRDLQRFLNRSADRLEEVRARRQANSRTLKQDVLPEAGWTAERVSGLIDQFGNEDGSSSAIAVMMSPDEYLAMNASARGREVIAQRVAEMEEYGGKLDVQRLSDSPPIYLGVALGGPNDTRPPPMVRGHDGRHRMELLRAAGVARVPVIVSLTDKDGKAVKVTEPMKVANIIGNRSRDPLERGDRVGEVNGVPVSFRYQDQLEGLGQRVLFQGGEGERGSTTFTDDGAKLIQLFSSADRSTLLHETGHIWLEELKADAADDEASAKDWEIVKKWFATNGHEVGPSGFIPTDAHEIWARGVERYFMEGKSPSLGLAGVFRTFKSWLLRIYGVVQNLQTPITPEIREVMDRMIATDQAIDDAQRMNAGAQPLFKTAEEAQMTDAEFADYQKRVSDARDEAYDALLFKTMESIRKRKAGEMRDARAGIRAEVAETINKQPQFRLLHLLRTGRWLGEPDRPAVDVKLNTGWLIDNFGEAILDRLPKGPTITSGKGETGDVIADMVGLGSGSEVVHTLVGMRAASDELRASGETRSMRDKLVSETVDREMADRYGDPLNDGTIEEEAIAAINSARQGEIIASEARQLSKRTHVLGTPTPYQFAREWAKRTVAEGHVRDVASRAAMQRYIRASNKSARLAEEAILAGDIDEAYRQKQAQLLNHALLAEAKAAADRIDRIVTKLKKLAGRAAQKSIDPEYFEKIQSLLENYDFKPKSQRAIDEQVQFQKWLEAQRAKGFEVHIPPRLDNNGTPYTRVSVQELESLGDLVDSLVTLGRKKQKLVLAGKERDFAEFRDLAVARLKAMRDRKMTERNLRTGFRKGTTAPINEQGSILSKIASDFIKIEKIAEFIDGGPTGPFNDLLTVGARNAENLRHQLRQEVMNPLGQAYKALGHKHWARLHDRVTIPELTWNTLNEGDPRLGMPVTITRSELLAIFMNMGNLSNLEKLSRGERWPVPVLNAVMDRELNKDDLDFAQTMWDAVEKLWPHIVTVEREMSGVVPERVVDSPIETRHGTYRGGYWPVVYDANRWQVAEDLEGKQLDDMFGLKSGVATQKGHTIARTGAFGPINLSLERVLFNHVEQVVTRAAYAPFARDVLRSIRDKSIRGWMDTKLGPEFRKQIEPWLLQQINAGAVNAKAARWWEKVLRQFRINTQIAAMGFRHTVLLAQSEGLLGSADRIGARWVATGLKRYATHPIDTVKFVLASSEEMRNRNEAFSREAAEMSARMRGKHSWFTTMQNFALTPIGWADRYTVSIPTWMGAYMKARGDDMAHDEAVEFADKNVRMSQGAGTPKDLAGVQARLGEGSRFFTMFYSPFNVMFNQQWAGIKALSDPRQKFMGMKGSPVPLLKTTFYWVMLTSMADAMLHGDWPDWGDPENIEKWFGRNVFFGLWAGVPIMRDLANWGNQTLGGQYAGDPGSTPVGRTLTAITKATKDAVKWEKTGESPTAPIKEAGNTIGVVGGVPTSQAGAAAQFLWDVHQGHQNPQSVSDWYFGLTKGKVPRPKNEAAQ